MNRLRDLREDKDLLQQDIAKYLKISQTGYSKYEVETNDIPTKVLKSLAIYYNTSIDYLLCLTDNRKAYPKSTIKQGEKNV
ncbi:MAG: helix-turn-helix domain-containing protein [Ruminococcus sp.]|nr:helix-turn-helix domain-containing protein [Ruminococcus sp.]